jgi:hypothetical protein
MWATIETAVNVAIRKAESKFRAERQQLEGQVRAAKTTHICAWLSHACMYGCL